MFVKQANYGLISTANSELHTIQKLQAADGAVKWRSTPASYRASKIGCSSDPEEATTVFL
jgi:hypothetical protein